MTDEERYYFDLRGYIVVPNAIDAETLAVLNSELDKKVNDLVSPDAPTNRFGDILSWSPNYRKLIDNPVITPYLEELLGAQFRLDHDYLDILRAGKGPTKGWLHGGGTPFDHSQFYRYDNGKIRNGLSVVAYNLADVNEGDGGFACVPGSHKSNLPFPDNWRQTDNPPSCMERITGPAGTAILFTEALTHGTLPWQGSHERRTLFFKYSPNAISWSAHYYNASDYPELGERAKAILEAPNARYPGRHQPKNIG